MGNFNNKGKTGNHDITFAGNILNTNVVVTASAVTTNMTNEHIENYVLNTLLPAHSVNTDGMSVLLISEYIPSYGAKILIPVLLIEEGSKEILKGGRNGNDEDDFAIPLFNKNKIRISENLRRALASITDEKIPYQTTKEKNAKYVFITMSMNEILKDMLNADGINYIIGIGEPKKAKGDNGQKSLMSFRVTKMAATRKNKKKDLALSDSGLARVAEHIANLVSRSSK